MTAISSRAPTTAAAAANLDARPARRLAAARRLSATATAIRLSAAGRSAASGVSASAGISAAGRAAARRPAAGPAAAARRNRRAARTTAATGHNAARRPADRDPGCARTGATERGRGDCAAGAENPEHQRRVLRPRQDHRPHHQLRRVDQRDGAVRCAAGDAARLLHAARDRGGEYRRLHRGGRDHAAGRDQARVHRLDVCREPRPARDRASDLRRVARRLQRTAAAGGRGSARSSRAGAAAASGAAKAAARESAAAISTNAGLPPPGAPTAQPLPPPPARPFSCAELSARQRERLSAAQRALEHPPHRPPAGRRPRAACHSAPAALRSRRRSSGGRS